MFKSLKRAIELSIKTRRIKYIIKQCDKHTELKTKLDCQRILINMLVDKYKKKYGEDLRKIKCKEE